MAQTRSELRQKCMIILYQITIYEKNHMNYNVDEVISEICPIDNEYVKGIVYGVITYKSEIDKVANEYFDGFSID